MPGSGDPEPLQLFGRGDHTSHCFADRLDHLRFEFGTDPVFLLLGVDVETEAMMVVDAGLGDPERQQIPGSEGLTQGPGRGCPA